MVSWASHVLIMDPCITTDLVPVRCKTLVINLLPPTTTIAAKEPQAATVLPAVVRGRHIGCGVADNLLCSASSSRTRTLRSALEASVNPSLSGSHESAARAIHGSKLPSLSALLIPPLPSEDAPLGRGSFIGLETWFGTASNSRPPISTRAKHGRHEDSEIVGSGGYTTI
jgi:hypothetical protein